MTKVEMRFKRTAMKAIYVVLDGDPETVTEVQNMIRKHLKEWYEQS